MKHRKILPCLSAIILMTALMTGCACKHETWNDATCTEPKTCADCGETEGEPLGHDWVNADCENPKTCSVCGETEGEPLEHEWNDATCEKPKTCKLCGETEGKPLEHEWSEATCEEPKTCKLCGKKSGKALGHKSDSPSCTKESKCTVCGKKIPAPGHKWKNATCTEPKKCSVCGTTEGEALGHTTDNGTCSRCGEEIELKVLMYQDDRISMYYQGMDYEDDYSKSVLVNLLIENNSDDNVVLQVENGSVNGIMISWGMSEEISPGNKSFVTVDSYISQDDRLIAGDVLSSDDVEYLNFDFRVFNWDDTFSRYTTGDIKIDAKNNTISSSGVSNSSEGTESNSSSGNDKTIQDVAAYFDGQCAKIEEKNNEDAMITNYEMKSDYYQIGYYIPDLEWVYHNEPSTYHNFISNCQDLAKTYKDYLDANGFEDYHVYIDIGADPPSGMDSPYEQVVILEIRDGEIGIDNTKNYYN